MNLNSDENLVAQYLKGDKKSLEILIKKYLKPIYNFVYRYVNSRIDTEDITQEIFLKVWRHLKKFDQTKSFKAWIFSIAKNSSIDSFRKSRSASGGKKIIPFSQLDNYEQGFNFIEKIVDSSPLPTEIFERQDLFDKVSQTIRKLSINYQLVLSLRYNEHLNFAEIAQKLSKSINTIKSHHRRAIIFLKKLLREF